jgi:hypothetical protein
MRAGEQRLRRRRASADEPEFASLPGRAWRVFDVVDAKIEHADVKAGLILGACGVTAAAVLGLIGDLGSPNLFLTITAIVSGLFILTTATFACGALWPRRLKNVPADSHLYFDHIARRSVGTPSVFERELKGLLADPNALTDEIVSQVRVNSKLASQKYNFLDRAMFCLFGSLFGLAASAVIFAIYHRGH